MKYFNMLFIIIAVPSILLSENDVNVSKRNSDQIQSYKDSIQTIEKIQIRKMEIEIRKLQEEIKDLQSTNKALSPNTRFITTILSAASGLVGALIGFFIFVLGRSVTNRYNWTQAAKLQQDKELSREAHNLELFKALSADNAKTRLAAASVLCQRLNYFKSKDSSDIDPSEELEKQTIINVLVSVTKEKIDEKITPAALIKFIADNLVVALDAVIPESEKPITTRSPLSDYDFQKANLQNVWWKRVDVRKIDFFEADLSNSGLAESFLENAVFYGANLSKCVFRKANLQNADLRNANIRGTDFSAANLESAKFQGAEFDKHTRWPANIDPYHLGAIKSED